MRHLSDELDQHAVDRAAAVPTSLPDGVRLAVCDRDRGLAAFLFRWEQQIDDHGRVMVERNEELILVADRPGKGWAVVGGNGGVTRGAPEPWTPPTDGSLRLRTAHQDASGYGAFLFHAGSQLRALTWRGRRWILPGGGESLIVCRTDDLPGIVHGHDATDHVIARIEFGEHPSDFKRR